MGLNQTGSQNRNSFSSDNDIAQSQQNMGKQFQSMFIGKMPALGSKPGNTPGQQSSNQTQQQFNMLGMNSQNFMRDGMAGVGQQPQQPFSPEYSTIGDSLLSDTESFSSQATNKNLDVFFVYDDMN